MFQHLPSLHERSARLRVLTWLYLTNGGFGCALVVVLSVMTILHGGEEVGRELLALAFLGVWSLAMLWIGLQLRAGSRRGVDAGILINILSLAGMVTGPSYGLVTIGMTVIMTLVLLSVRRELR